MCISEVLPSNWFLNFTYNFKQYLSLNFFKSINNLQKKASEKKQLKSGVYFYLNCPGASLELGNPKIYHF